MEKPPPAKHAVSSTKLCLFPGSSSYEDDDDVIEVTGSSLPSWASSSHLKRKRSQVVPHDIVEINEDRAQDAVVIIGESASDYKNKQPVGCDMHKQNQVKATMSNGLIGSSTIHDSDDDPFGSTKTLDTVSVDLNYTDQDDYIEDDYYEDDYEDYEYDVELIENDCDFNLAAKFDGLDLPPGVEAVVSSLQKPVPARPVNDKMKAPLDIEVDVQYNLFKQFDTVEDCSDHHFSKPELLKLDSATKKPSKDWAKRIQNDWKILEKDLPEKIYVRVYEDRMDLLRAVIVGPDGTPYHDGLFFFDVYFPPSYPNDPPKVYYHSGGLRLNPNLYACGKVCLSLLNTWSGSGCEKWSSVTSTMLQVLVSIQGLVLNEKPYFNEPGYAGSANTPTGERKSLVYNEDTFLLSCKTMLYSLRRPPKHFEAFVAGHFRRRGRAILVACQAYMNGAQVGCLSGDGVQDVDAGDKSSSVKFKQTLKILFEDMLMEFTVKGADCKEFLTQKVKDGAAKAADTTLKL